MPATEDPSRTPTLRCLKDIINDEHVTKYGAYSDIDITAAATLGRSASPQFAYEFAPPNQIPNLPPPSLIYM